MAVSFLGNATKSVLFNLSVLDVSDTYLKEIKTYNLGSHGRVRLRGGIVPEAGTVEYCVSGSWRAVCDNSWDYKDAFVVCRQLGFPATSIN